MGNDDESAADGCEGRPDDGSHDADAGFPGRAIQMDAEKKERLRDLMEEAGVRSWARDYHPVGYMVLDGWGWTLTIHFKNGKVFASAGSNAWPETLQARRLDLYRNMLPSQSWTFCFEPNVRF